VIARGSVVRPGRTLTVCEADVVTFDGGRERPVARMLATLMALADRPDLPGGM
jgi:acyl-coenzyme A thioesterase PaaI-like protein